MSHEFVSHYEFHINLFTMLPLPPPDINIYAYIRGIFHEGFAISSALISGIRSRGQEIGTATLKVIRKFFFKA